MSKSYYVYIHRRATNGKVFYVGKGCDNRAYTKHGRNRRWNNIVNKHGFTVEIVQDGMQSWWALEMEMELIALYDRKNLANLTDGGDGNTGLDAESKKLLSSSLKKVKKTDEWKRKIAIANTGKKKSKEHVEAMVAAQKSSVKGKEKLHKMNMAKRRPVKNSAGMVFEGFREAARWLQNNGWPKAIHGNIGISCRSKTRKTYGYKWEYVDI